MTRQQIGWRLCVKRSIDVGCALGLLTLGAPLIALTAAAVRLDLGAPVLFRQQRPGRNAVPFMLYKFRTMRDGPEPDAQRLTRLGQVLRKTSVDELPQLFNVLRGEMSLVGPRPLLMEYLTMYSPRQARRHEVLPGITGWAQVNGRNAIEHEQRFELDLWYVDHWSLLLDLRILAVTLARVFRREGISAGGHATMPLFRGGGPGVEREGGFGGNKGS